MFDFTNWLLFWCVLLNLQTKQYSQQALSQQPNNAKQREQGKFEKYAFVIKSTKIRSVECCPIIYSWLQKKSTECGTAVEKNVCCVYDEQNSKGQNSRDWKLFSALQWLRGVIRQFWLSEVEERQRGTRHGIDVGHKSRPSTSSECGEGAWRCPSQDLRRFSRHLVDHRNAS